MKGPRQRTGSRKTDGGDDALGDLLGTLGAALTEMIARLDRGGTGEVRRDIAFETDGGPVHAQAGVRVRVGGFDTRRTGVDRPSDPSGPRHPVRGPRDETREPETREGTPSAAPPDRAPPRPIQAEIADDGTVWRLTAELPGVARDDLRLEVDDAVLLISAEAHGRRYADTVTLPSGTTYGALCVSLFNGILEIEVPSARREAE